MAWLDHRVVHFGCWFILLPLEPQRQNQNGPCGRFCIQALGLNDDGLVVGSYVDSHGNIEGFVSITRSPVFIRRSPGAETETVINGVNNQGQLVRFDRMATSIPWVRDRTKRALRAFRIDTLVVAAGLLQIRPNDRDAIDAILCEWPDVIPNTVRVSCNHALLNPSRFAQVRRAPSVGSKLYQESGASPTTAKDLANLTDLLVAPVT